jgi:predicted acylesterase/phospholipase RssA
MMQACKDAVALYRAMRGHSLLNTGVLRNFLSELFNDATRKAGKTPEPPFDPDRNPNRPSIELLVTGSDLAASKGINLNGDPIEMLVHSSAIPFVFRSFRDLKVSTIVDGGLCENLPVEELVRREDPDGPVLCVSVENPNENDSRQLPTNIREYCGWLISAPMNHNVLRARSLAGENNVFEAVGSLGTFEFEQAIDKLADDRWYDEAKEEAQDRIRGIAELYSSVVSPHQEATPAHLFGRLSAPKIMRSLAQVFDNAPTLAQWDYLQSAFVVRAECLRNEARKPADQIMRSARIRAKGPNLSCFSSAAMLTREGSIVPTKWTCYNETQNRAVAIHPIPVKNDTALNMVDVLIFFEDPRHAVVAGDTLVIKSYFLMPQAMIALETAGRDHIGVTNPHAAPIAQTDIVLLYPAGFGKVLAVGEANEAQIPQSVKDTYLGAASEGYQAAGCSAAMLPNTRFRVNFFRQS